ncbi:MULTISPECIES: hypothetical protein [unclassified Hoeflea]|jgi:hypothetical protein|uniref:hypothetical protein n=1 Tax=unclassified Hoeflea TaxID=2614931 RepID=UPI002AFFA837|nr:hypothetical protein [Hoeflea sp.]
MAQNTVNDWKWVVDHYKTLGIWDSACDHRDIGEGIEQRCYVRIVDVYAPRPDFGAAFVFVTRSAQDGLRFEFSFERGTQFEAGGFAIIEDGESTFDYAPGRCEGGTRCLISGQEAERFASALGEDAVIRLAFTDSMGRDWQRDWSGKGFAAALADLRAESEKRGL